MEVHENMLEQVASPFPPSQELVINGNNKRISCDQGDDLQQRSQEDVALQISQLNLNDAGQDDGEQLDDPSKGLPLLEAADLFPERDCIDDGEWALLDHNDGGGDDRLSGEKEANTMDCASEIGSDPGASESAAAENQHKKMKTYCTCLSDDSGQYESSNAATNGESSDDNAIIGCGGDPGPEVFISYEEMHLRLQRAEEEEEARILAAMAAGPEEDSDEWLSDYDDF